MSTISWDEARRQNIELLDLLISVHEKTQYADMEVDNDVLKLMRTLLAEYELNQSELREKTSDLLLLYTKKAFNNILRFIRNSASYYIDYDETWDILQSAERAILSKTKDSEILIESIQKLSEERKRLVENERKLNGKGKRKFYGTFLLFLGIIATFLVGLAQELEWNQQLGTVKEIGIFITIIMYFYLCFDQVYVRLIITTEKGIFKRFTFRQYIHKAYLHICMEV